MQWLDRGQGINYKRIKGGKENYYYVLRLARERNYTGRMGWREIGNERENNLGDVRGFKATHQILVVICLLGERGKKGFRKGKILMSDSLF